MKDRLWAYLDGLCQELSREMGADLDQPLKVVGHKPLSDGSLPEGMQNSRFGRVLKKPDDEVLLQGLSTDDRIGSFLLRVGLKNAPALNTVIPMRYDLGGRVNGAVAGVVRLMADPRETAGVRFVPYAVRHHQTDKKMLVEMSRNGLMPHALADTLNNDPEIRRLAGALPEESEWEAHNITLRVDNGGEIVCRKDHSLVRIGWVPVFSAGFTTFNVNHHFKDAFNLLKLIAITLKDTKEVAPPTSKPSSDLEFFKDVDKLGATGLPHHASQAREHLDHFVDLMRHERGEDTIWPLLSKESPLRKKGELTRLRELLRLSLGKESWRVQEVDWRYNGLKQAIATLHTPAGDWRATMKKGDKHWEVFSVDV